VPIDIFVEIEQTMERVCRELRKIPKYKMMWDELVANPKTGQNGIKKKTAARFISRFWQEEEPRSRAFFALRTIGESSLSLLTHSSWRAKSPFLLPYKTRCFDA
jgi:hypothetical protein